MAAWLARVPSRAALITGRGYSLLSTTHWLIRFSTRVLYKISLLCCNTVIFQNHDDLHYFVKTKLVPVGKAHVVNGSGVNLRDFQPVPLPGRPSFLLIARLLRSKGIIEYFEAARSIKSKWPDVEFHLVGPRDPSPDAIPETVLEAALSDGIVKYHGATTDVRPYLEKCSIYVLPSYYGEGVPRSVLEALAMGRPAIVADTPGCRDTVVDGRTGFLVPPRDGAALAAAMSRFIDQPHLADKLGNAARDFVASHFGVDLVNEQMFAALGVQSASRN
jgi:glycosyltransferase involved in cell wall biosynthesis